MAMDGSMMMGVVWFTSRRGVVRSVSCCGVVMSPMTGVVVAGAGIGGGVCVGTCVEVGEGDGDEEVIIITGCVMEHL